LERTKSKYVTVFGDSLKEILSADSNLIFLYNYINIFLNFYFGAGVATAMLRMAWVSSANRGNRLPSSPNLPPTQPHIQWLPGVHYTVVNRRGLGSGYTMKLIKLKLQGPSDAGGNFKVPGRYLSNALEIS
jgi:hypothetical protein